MSTLWQNIQLKMLRSGSKMNLLIFINVAVYLLLNIPITIEENFFVSSHIRTFSNEYLLLPASLHTLETRFWTPLTYMFMHAGVFHILYNMLWFYWFGQIFEEYLGKKRTLGLYLMGGLMGAFIYILGSNTIPGFVAAHAADGGSLVGASAAVMAVIIATATLLPDYTLSFILIGPIRLKWLALFFVITDFLGTSGFNGGGELSHLGGALIGFVYIKQLQNGKDWIAFIGKIGNLFKRKSKLKVVFRNNSGTANTYPRQEEIDFILDKISKAGYPSLTRQEKEILARASKDE